MEIAWVCPKPSAPSGGVWFIHRLAALAGELIDDSWVALTEPFEVWWDANPQFQGGTHFLDSISGADVVIVPEGLWDSFVLPEGNTAKKICFMQNYIWLNKEHFRANPGPMITCSRFMSNYAEDKLGVKPLGILSPFLDDGVWEPQPPPSNSVLVMGRRSEIGARLTDLLRNNDYRVDYVDQPISQRELAHRLKQSSYYVHTPSPEGFPMAALEAMRSCVPVVGTTGGGGNEFMFHNQTAHVVQDPELGLYENKFEYVRRLKNGIDWLRDNPGECNQMTIRAKSWSERYTSKATKAQLSKILTSLESR